MQATITYLLTEQAQRAQMAATGQPVARKQTSVEDIPTSWLDLPYLVKVDPDGAVTVDLTDKVYIGRDGRIGGYGWAGAGGPLEEMPTSGLDALEKTHARILAKQQQVIADAETAAAKVREQEVKEALENEERERKAAPIRKLVNEWLADPRAQAVSIDTNPFGLGLMGPDGVVTIDAQTFLYSDVVKWVDIARKRREIPKSDYIAAWVAEHGDDVLRAQFADGLACRKSIIGMIADAAFTASGVPEEHPDSKVCDNRDCPCNDNTVDCLPTGIYARWSEIKSRLPEGSRAEFHRVQDCLRDEDGEWIAERDGGESATDPYYVAVIKMPHGPFTFERLVKL